MFGTSANRDWRQPMTVWLIVLGAVFVSEYAVMLALPFTLPEHPNRMLESAVDAIMLSLVLAPILWWTVVRPLREVIRLRTKFVADLFAAIEAERRQTAHELHDGVGQSLTLLISSLKSAHETITDASISGRCHSLLELARAALSEVKRLSLGLRPSLLDDLGLVSAIERVVADVRGNYPVEITLDAPTLVNVRFPEPVETAVFRIVQEALSNVIKHSGSREATIELRYGSRELTLQVSDTGCGFDPAAYKRSANGVGHLGLVGMRERVELLGGRYMIESAPGRGCRVTVSIPVDASVSGES